MCMHVGKLQLAMSPLHALALQRSRSRGTSCVCDLGALHCEHPPPHHCHHTNEESRPCLSCHSRRAVDMRCVGWCRVGGRGIEWVCWRGAGSGGRGGGGGGVGMGTRGKAQAVGFSPHPTRQRSTATQSNTCSHCYHLLRHQYCTRRRSTFTATPGSQGDPQMAGVARFTWTLATPLAAVQAHSMMFTALLRRTRQDYTFGCPKQGQGVH